MGTKAIATPIGQDTKYVEDSKTAEEVSLDLAGAKDRYRAIIDDKCQALITDVYPLHRQQNILSDALILGTPEAVSTAKAMHMQISTLRQASEALQQAVAQVKSEDELLALDLTAGWPA